MKILIADDSLLDRKLVMGMLKKSGVENEVMQASNGEEALEILSREYQNICVILLDWQMPIMDGISFMKAVVKVPAVSDIPIVMVTASSSEDNRTIAKEVNPKLAGYLVKPYTPEQLVATINSYLQ